MIDPKLLKRIKACLALAASANEHEAALALTKARELMDAYGVTDDDLASADIGDATARGSRNNRPAGWESILSATVCRALGVTALLDDVRDRRFVGRGPAPEIAAYAFTTLYRHLKRARGEYIARQLRRCSLARKRARADAFCEGWAGAVFTKIARLYPKREDDAAIEQYLTATFGQLVPAGTRAASGGRTDRDRWRGWDQGAQVDLHHGVGGGGLTPGRIAHG